MRIAMLEAGKKASQIPVEYHVEEEKMTINWDSRKNIVKFI